MKILFLILSLATSISAFASIAEQNLNCSISTRSGEALKIYHQRLKVDFSKQQEIPLDQDKDLVLSIGSGMARDFGTKMGIEKNLPVIFLVAHRRGKFEKANIENTTDGFLVFDSESKKSVDFFTTIVRDEFEEILAVNCESDGKKLSRKAELVLEQSRAMECRYSKLLGGLPDFLTVNSLVLPDSWSNPSYGMNYYVSAMLSTGEDRLSVEISNSRYTMSVTQNVSPAPIYIYAAGAVGAFRVEPAVKVAAECGLWKNQDEKRIETKELPKVTANQDRNRLVYDFDFSRSLPKLDRFETSLVVDSNELEGRKDLSRILLTLPSGKQVGPAHYYDYGSSAQEDGHLVFLVDLKGESVKDGSFKVTIDASSSGYKILDQFGGAQETDFFGGFTAIHYRPL